MPRTLESFDAISETWEQSRKLKGAFPNGLQGMAVVTDGNEKAFTFGGFTDASYYSNAVYEVDLSGAKCRELVPANPSYAPKRKAFSGMVLVKGKLVVYGGYNNNVVTDTLHIFDLLTSK